MSIIAAYFPNDLPVRFPSWPTNDQLLRKLDIALDEDDFHAADVMRRYLAARGVPVTRAVPVEPSPAPPERPSHTRRPECKARTHDPSTARRAAAAAAPRAGTHRALLLDAILAAPDGLTAEQAGAAAGVRYDTASTRVHDLKRDGFVEPHGTRATSSGVAADVLVATEQARELVAA